MKKYNEIQLTENKNGLEQQKNKNHPPSPGAGHPVYQNSILTIYQNNIYYYKIVYQNSIFVHIRIHPRTCL